MLEIALLIAAQAVLLGAVVILREPKLLIPCVILGLPFEFLETELMDSLGSSGAAGAVRSMLNPGQAAMAATVVVVAVRERHTPWRLIPNSSLLLPLGLLCFLLFAGVGWSDNPLRPDNSVLILPLYIGFVLAAPTLVEDRRDLERIAGAFLLAAVLLALLAVSQRLLGVFTWRDMLFSGGVYRSNATFSDPNMLARFLVIAIGLAAGLVLATGPRRQTLYLAAPTLAVGSIAVLATGSRSGWVMLLLVGFVVVMTAPIARYTKARLTLGALGALVLGVGLLLMQGGADAERVKSLTNSASLIGQREFLIRAGWEMWKDSPLIGWGTGNFQETLIVGYLDYLPWWARTTLSHTSAISVLAELGIVGAAALLFVSLRIGATMVRAYFATGRVYNRLFVGWLGAALLGILFSSQSEGRLLDDPFLWVFFALVIAIETAPGLTGKPHSRGVFEPKPRGELRRETAGGALPVPAAAASAE
ncbi:MAG: O-antigen ligase family protein [Dehalococcoidia bacterium]|nr:O-antigen ligase family protein [Dehalococcoidia bacterium]